MARLSLPQARRIALAAQGFTDSRPRSAPTVRQFRRAMNRMSALQLDSVNVLCRSHYLPMLARLGPFDRDKLDNYLYRSGEHFELYTHEAAIISQDLQPHMRYRANEVRWKAGPRLEQELPGYVDAVLDEVSEHGPLSIKDLSEPGERSGPWWGQSKGKVALDWLYHTGRLSIRERTPMFVTVYDRPENVIRPDVLARPQVERRDALKHQVALGARSHGIGTDKDLADYFRLKVTEVRPLLDELVADGSLERVDVTGWGGGLYLHTEAKRPRRLTGRALLTPFDPVVWFRPRAEALFDFHYRIEIYTPEPKRVYGYYVLPFLLDDELVGRVDLKADRKARLLLVNGAFLEERITEPVERDRVAAELWSALDEMAEWLDLDGVSVADNGDLAAQLLRSRR
ncbi:MAG: winged helix DNA-binding domain-containing protein [Acidimicrobiia bacterium]|nr:winged helix DNA-binding domain-containing protein [Acidimicrobiia bacterium]MDH5519561.1 winged helix DNA-binding domain-containing protein [Acidimicrobiia bacterium]